MKPLAALAATPAAMLDAVPLLVTTAEEAAFAKTIVSFAKKLPAAVAPVIVVNEDVLPPFALLNVTESASPFVAPALLDKVIVFVPDQTVIKF